MFCGKKIVTRIRYEGFSFSICLIHPCATDNVHVPRSVFSNHFQELSLTFKIHDIVNLKLTQLPIG